MHRGKEKGASIALLLSAVTRYEVWFVIPFLFYLKKEKSLYFVVPSILFILAWFTYTLRFRVLRATDFKILEKTHTVLINIKNFE
jgi:hypothetical protein